MSRLDSFQAFAPYSEPLYIVQDRNSQTVTPEGLYLGPQLSSTQLQVEKSHRAENADRGIRAVRARTDDPRGINFRGLHSTGHAYAFSQIGQGHTELIKLFGDQLKFIADLGRSSAHLHLSDIEALTPTLLLTREALTDAFTEFHGATLRPNTGEESYFPYPQLPHDFSSFVDAIRKGGAREALFALID